MAATITVKNPAARIKVDGKTVKKPTVVVGSKTVLTGVSAPKDSAITFKSSDKTIATVDADGTLTALKAGTVNIAATNALGAKYVINVTVKAFDFQSVKQTKAAELEVVLAGDTKGLGASSVQITNTFNNINYAVKSFTLDKNDPTKAKIETYQSMKDGKDYKVVIGNTEQTFTATDGVVAAVGLERNTVVAATETKINAQTMDANGIILDQGIAYPGNGTTVTMTYSNLPNDGWCDDGVLYLNKVGDTVTFDVVYHSGKWDNATGTETVIESKGLTVTAVDATAIDKWDIKIGEKSDSSFATVKETRIAANDDHRYAYIQMTDSAKATSTDISNYNVESSNPDALIVGTIDYKNGMVELLPYKAGTTYLVIRDKNTQNVVTTLQVVIVADRKAASLTLDKTFVSLTAINGYEDSAEVAVTVKDQYGEILPISEKEVTVATENKDIVSVSQIRDGKFTVSELDKSKTVTVTVTYEQGANKRTQSLTVSVGKAPVGDANGVVLDVSATRVDTIINSIDPRTIDIKLFEAVDGAKKSFLNITENEDVTLTLSKYTINSTTRSAVAINPIVETDVKVLSATTDGGIKLTVNDPTTGWKLENGTYTLTVTKGSGDNKKTVEKKIIVTDTQPKITVSRKNESGKSVSGCFEVYYDGKLMETNNGLVNIKYYKSNGDMIVENDTYGPVSVGYAIVTVNVNVGNNVARLAQKVNIGLTVRVE